MKFLLKASPNSVVFFIITAMILIPAMACNLPPRHSNGLTFPTSQPSSSSSDLIFPASDIPAILETPGTATSTPGSIEPGQLPSPFLGLQTATPGPGIPDQWSTPNPVIFSPPFTYWTQPGDTLTGLAGRFGVNSDQITPPQPASGLLPNGQLLTIPNMLGEPPYGSALLPDSLIIYSPEAANFEIDTYIDQAGGYLSSYEEMVGGKAWLTGAEIIQRVALESSINPKLLLAFLEFRSGWVRGQPFNHSQVEHPIGFYVPEYKGLYLELALVAKELNIGYYGWRQGTLTDLTFPDYTHMRVNPAVNAGTFALQTLTSKFYRQQGDWLEALHSPHGFLALYTEMFGDPWLAAAEVEPLFQNDLIQPTLELPFGPGEYWSLTSGPHISWRTGTPRGALDFAPITGEPPCTISTAWVTASASGMVVRSEGGLVTLDLDGDGLEQTGWVLVYMHISEKDRVPAGTWVETDDPLGHPSCEGGTATGTHVHLSRKYNGEWLAADGPLPMVLSGWIPHAGELSYEGSLENGGQIVSARPDGSAGSTIVR